MYLEKYQDNVKDAAKALDISYSTIYRVLNRDRTYDVVEFPFEGADNFEIVANNLHGVVSIPKHAGGKVPESGVT